MARPGRTATVREGGDGAGRTRGGRGEAAGSGGIIFCGVRGRGTRERDGCGDGEEEETRGRSKEDCRCFGRGRRCGGHALVCRGLLPAACPCRLPLPDTTTIVRPSLAPRDRALLAVPAISPQYPSSPLIHAPRPAQRGSALRTRPQHWNQTRPRSPPPSPSSPAPPHEPTGRPRPPPAPSPTPAPARSSKRATPTHARPSTPRPPPPPPPAPPRCPTSPRPPPPPAPPPPPPARWT